MNIRKQLQRNNASIDALAIPAKLKDRAGGSILVVMKQLGRENRYAIVKDRYGVDEQAKSFINSFELNDISFFEEILKKLGL